MSLPRVALTFALGLLALLGRPALVPAAVAAPSLSALAARADRIVVAEVVEVRCEADPARGDQVPVTLVTVRVTRTLKGAAGSHLVLEFLGGRVGDDSLKILDLPRFAVGDRDVLFLSGDGHRASPLVGVMYGRFRVVASAEGTDELVAAHDGRLIRQSELAEDLVARQAPAASGDPVSLALFEKRVLALVAGDARLSGRGVGVGDALPLDRGTKPRPAPQSLEALLPDLSAARLRVVVNLGASPALFDGCPDWSCALESKEWFRRLSSGSGETTSEAAAPVERVSLEMRPSVFGRLLDNDTLALAITEAKAGVTRTRVVFNQQLAWNAYRTGTSPPADGPLDLTSVAAAELSLVARAAAAATAVAPLASPAVGGDRVAARRAPPSRSGSSAEQVQPAAAGCGGGDVFVDPRLLVFDSPDHALMTAYQVGFFQPGAASPAQVIDVPLTAFLIRRVVDLPSSAVLAMQTSLVADIRSAGLATPLGVVYTYRVRGVWGGGTTAWSDSSQPFVRCGASAADR